MIVTGSMEPTLKRGGVVIPESVQSSGVGDIIAYKIGEATMAAE